jgi:sodium transport system permease protein
MNAAWAVFRKELVDALRDRRTLLVALLTSVAIGPLVLLLVSSLVGDLERQADQRVLRVHGAEYAPTLVNFVERQSFAVEPAPADYEAKLRAGKLGDAVVIVPEDFEQKLARGEAPAVEVIGNQGQAPSATAARRAQALLQAFNQERALLRQLSLGIAPSAAAIEVQERDLANRGTRAAQLTAMVPFFVLMAVLYGSVAAAMDTTAGERERGSLEPLLMNPPSRMALVLGKWAAVAAVGMLIAALSCLSFLPAQSLMRSETLAALFQFGLWEALMFIAILLPFAAAAAAVMMAVAIRAKSFKEAQANNTGVVMAITLAPMVSLFSQDGESAWHLWVPALGQVTLMNRVLKGEAVLPDVFVTLAACALAIVLGLTYLGRSIQGTAVR